MDEVIKIDPQLEQAWYSKALALNQSGRMEEALQSLDQALAMNDQNAQAWAMKSALLQSLGQAAEAEEALAKAKGLGYAG